MFRICFYFLFLTAAIAAVPHVQDTSVGKSWSFTEMAPVTTLIGVYSTGREEVFTAMADNSIGPGVTHSNDSGVTSDFIGPVGGMNMDIAFTNKRYGCLVGLGGMYVTHDAETFEKVPDVRGVSQNVESLGDSFLGATGGFMLTSDRSIAVNGVIVSRDAGATWDLYDIGVESEYMARYASFPTEDTWYVSSGSWPSDSTDLEGERHSEHHMRLSERVTAHKDGRITYKDKNSSLRESTTTASGEGYPGAISKTTDGGKTWTKVFDTEGSAYFNEISCFDTQNCMVVGENGDGAVGYATQDGGASWKKVLSYSDGGSLMACKMLSVTEAWMSGGGMDKGLTGHFYHTTDAGVTWDLTTLPMGYSMDLSFSSSTAEDEQGSPVGYSVALSQAAATVAIYK